MKNNWTDKLSINDYKLILKHSPLGYAYHKVLCSKNDQPYDYCFLDINPAFEKLTGLEAQDIIGKSVTAVIPGIRESGFDWVKVYGDIALNGGFKDFTQYSAPLNKWYKVNVFSPAKYYFITYFSDVTEEVQQREELQLFFDVVLDLLCITDTEGSFVKLNKAWEDILGYSIEELKQRKLFDFIHPEDLKDTIDMFSTLAHDEKTASLVNRYYCKNGSYRYIEWRSRRYDNLIYTVAKDITEKKLIEQKLIETNKELSDFAFRVSHDLKGPINIIRGYAEAAIDNSQMRPAFLDKISAQADKLINFIDGVLQLSRAGRSIGEKESLDLNKLIAQVYSAIKIPEVQSKFVLENEIPIFKGDVKSFEHVFINLIQNSFKYRDPKKDTLIINMGFKSTLSKKIIYYKDNGIGMEEKYVQRVFKPGFALNKNKGTGFGLTIVKKIIEAHGGSITAYSEGLKKGMEFHILMPDLQ